MERISLASARVRKVLERETVAHARTLEQKISDQGPAAMRVDPHLLGYALHDLVEREILVELNHTGAKWFTHKLGKPEPVAEKLEQIAPLYAQVSKGGFPNRVGDALEVVVFKAIRDYTAKDRRYQFFGSFDLDAPKNAQQRYRKNEPPQRIGDRATKKQADFIMIGHDEGPLLIECKNYREWLYPDSELIKELIIKSQDLDAIPVLIYRRIQYSTITNLLRPAGIIAHQSYHQYYPADEAALAAQVSHRRVLGFTDVTASETPHPRTTRFVGDLLPQVLPDMAARWRANKEALYAFATDEINIAQLYTAIGSPAGGKWEDREPTEDDVAEAYEAFYDGADYQDE